MMTTDSTRGYRRSPILDPMGQDAVNFPAGPLSEADGVTRCYNLRPAASGGLEGVGRPVEMLPDRLPGAYFVPGGVFCHPDGMISTLLVRDKELFVTNGDDYASLGSLPAPALTAVACSDGWTVMTEAGPAKLRCTGGIWGLAVSPADLPPLMFERLDGTVFSTQTNPHTAISSYSINSSVLSGIDTGSMTVIVSNAYRRLAGMAIESRQFIQPVIARYRLRGYSGEVVYTSAPVMISPDSGLQADVFDIPMSGDKYREFGSADVSATGFTIGLRLTGTPGPEWKELVSRVEILVSPQFHPFSPKLECTGRMVRGADGGFTMRVTLPGTSSRIRPGEKGGCAAHRVAGILARVDSALKVVASAPAPDEASPLVRVCPYDAAVTSLDAELSHMGRIFLTPVAEPEPWDLPLSRISPPHTFAASAGAANGNSVLWGGIVSIPFAGYPLGELTASAEPLPGGGVPAAVKVVMADGSSVVRESVFHSLRPSRLSPLVVYPSGEARSITVVTPGGTLTFPLVPAPGGDWSYCLDPGLCPVVLPQDSADGFAVPASAPVPTEWPGHVALASAGSPLLPVSTSRSGVGRVAVIVPESGAGSSLDMSRNKFYAFGAGGISRVTCSPSGVVSSSALSRLGVSSPAGVVETPVGVVAIAGGTPVLIQGKNVRTLRAGLRGDMAGWNAPRGELWVLSPDSQEVTVVRLADGTCYTRCIESIASTLSTPAGLRLLTVSGGMLDGTREKEFNTRVVHRSRIRSNLTSDGVYRVPVRLFGSVIDTSLRLTADCGVADGSAATLFDVSNDGNLRHPTLCGFRSVHSHFLTLEVSALTARPSQLLLK